MINAPIPAVGEYDPASVLYSSSARVLLEWISGIAYTIVSIQPSQKQD